jgi:hypothetical protein
VILISIGMVSDVLTLLMLMIIVWLEDTLRVLVIFYYTCTSDGLGTLVECLQLNKEC